MQSFSKAALLAASVLSLSAGSALADFDIEILHNNDFHSRFDPINKYDSSCPAEDDAAGECFGGAARLLTAINETRAALEADGKNVILLNAGDNFQGSLFYTFYKGEMEGEFMNMLGYDAMTVGNHEFDDSEDGLKTFLDIVTFPVVTANVKTNADSTVKGMIEPSIVLDIDGEKVGIIGAVTNDTPEIASPGKNIDITVDVDAITTEVEKLQGEGVNKIIALTHVGYPRDLAAIAVIPGVDVVVGGHSHTLLSNTDEDAAGPYPTMVDNPDGYQVPVVQANQYGKYLGDLSVVFNDDGVVTSAKGDPILLDASFTPDENVTSWIAEKAEPLEELKMEEVGESSALIVGDRDVCRTEECPMGNLVADAMLERVADQGISIAIQNGGGVRASIDPGVVTMGEVLTVLPFQNTIATFQLKGSDLVAALENGLSQIEDGGGRYPQVSGLKYTYDASKAPGSRVVSVEVETGEDEFAPIELDTVYGIVTNNYVRGGGDGYAVFAENGMNAYDFGPNLEEAVAEYLGMNSPYIPYVDGRITNVAHQ
nr:bifunctional metallophosphatase/5'-nucleotidase [Marinicella sp. W31]MDC2878634.1 bifunctional metallophosphatase/5'-nucleotidase [Marinicella sp. W31]